MNISNNGLKIMESNEDINNLLGLIDLVTDEYNNYYHVMRTKIKDTKLEEVSLSHFYYDSSYAILADLDDESKELYRYEHFGNIITDRLANSIKRVNESKRKIFTIEDLLNNQTKVVFLDITKEHPRANPKNQ